MTQSTKRKTFVIDTSVLLYDGTSIHSFPDSDLVIPMIVLDELDRFKDKADIVGENARYVNRYLDRLRSKGSLHKGVTINETGQTIRVSAEVPDTLPAGLNGSSGDNKIIGLAHQIVSQNDSLPVIVITKDINLRVKCDALNIAAEDYYKDNVSSDVLYVGYKTLRLTSEEINQIHDLGILSLDDRDDIVMWPNEMAIVKSITQPKHSVLAIRKRQGLVRVHDVKMNNTVTPRNKEQKLALYLLTDPDIPLVTVTGISGSGKTFLALMTGLNSVWNDNHKRVVITRPIIPVGRDLGYLPGDIHDKMFPWLTPITDNFRDGVSDKNLTYFESMQQKGQIEIAPLSYIRGRTFNNCFIIVDEAQNATIHELRTIITRVGRNSKLVLLGDTDQVDTPYIDNRSNGLSIVVERCKNEWLVGHIRLPKGERSDLATLGSRLF